MKKTNDHFKRKWIFTFLLSLLTFSNIFAQDMISREPTDYPAGTTISPGTITLPPAKLNELEIYTIPLLVSSPFTIYTSAVIGSCSDIDNNHSINNVDNVINLQVTEKCNSVSSSISFILHVEKTGNVPDQQQFTVPIERDRAKIALVLDISGSMSLNVQGTTDARIDELKYAVNQLMPKLELFKQAGDSLAMSYFSSNVIQPTATYFPETFIPIDDTDVDFNKWSSVRVYNDIDPRTPLQMTALGEGLLDAKSKLNLDISPDLRRMVFLFTDGIQNWGNQLKDDGLTFYGSNDSLNNYSTNPKDSIYYFPVATWAAGDQPELFQNIVDANKGEVLFVTPHTPLNSWFNNQLVNMLDHGSPQIVIEKTANSISGELNYSFNLNENINTLAVELSTKGDMKMRIFKDGVDITSKAGFKSGDRFNLVSFEFPIITDPVIHSGGEWNIVLTGDSQEPFDLAVIADDHYSDYDCSVNKSMFTVGDTIHFNTKLSYKGTPITGGSNSVKAILLKPGDDLGHLLSIYETPDSDSTIDVNTGAANKFNELLANDTSFFNALLPEKQIIDLIEKGTGEFIGQYSNTDLSGIYNVIFLVNGEIPNYGKLERSKTISIIVVFGQVEEEEPIIVDSLPAGIGNYSKYTVLQIKPINKLGKYMGPGFQSKIKVSVNKKPIPFYKSARTQVATHKESINVKTDPFVAKIDDNLDGSYNIVIANVSEEDNPDISISIRGETLYEGKLKPIPFWYYILVVIIILILLLLKRSKSNSKAYKLLMWILLLICVVIYLLHKFGILFIL